MKKFRQYNPEQSFLFPPRLDEFVPKGHVAHFIRELVCRELNLKAILSSYSEAKGAPPYSPVMMTALLIYAYSRGVYSSRKIARGCEERLDFLAVSGMNKPDFRSIAKFRVRHHEALRGLFVQVLRLCEKAKLVDLKHVAIDGTRIPANASLSKNKRYKSIKEEERLVKEEVDRWLKAAEELDAEEDEEYGADLRGDETPEWMNDPRERLEKIRKIKQELEEKDKEEREQREKDIKEGKKDRTRERKREEPLPERKYNTTDPDSEVMKSRRGFIQGYNAQAAVDSKDHIIVAVDVSTKASDQGELIPMVKGIRRNCRKKPKEISADSSYCSEANLRNLRKLKVRGYLSVSSKVNKVTRAIPKGSERAAMLTRLKRGGKRTRYWIRSKTVEPVFGIIKSARGFQQFLLRGVELVRSEFSLVATVHNILKLAKIRLQPG